MQSHTCMDLWGSGNSWRFWRVLAVGSVSLKHDCSDQASQSSPTPQITLSMCCWLSAIAQWLSTSVLPNPSEWPSLLHFVLCLSLFNIQDGDHIPGSGHTMHPHLDIYNTIVMGTITSDTIVRCCKGPNQSMPPKYVKKAISSFWEQAQIQFLSLGVIKPNDRCLVYAQEISGSVWLDTTNVGLGSH